LSVFVLLFKSDSQRFKFTDTKGHNSLAPMEVSPCRTDSGYMDG